MSSTRLKRILKQCARPTFKKLGFSEVSSTSFERTLDGFTQGVNFVEGVKSLSGRFSADVYWRFTLQPLAADEEMHCCRRIGDFTTGSDEWFVIDEQNVSAVMEVVSVQVYSFFEKHRTIRDILRSYEQGDYSADVLFGEDAGWRAFNLAWCYLWVGDNAQAKRFLREVIDVHSSWPTLWVKERKDAALHALDSLQN